MKVVDERSVKIRVPETDKLSSQNKIFYNPERVIDRDLSVLILNALGWKDFKMIDLMAASGVRGLRVCKECKPKKVYFNDISPSSAENIKNNIERNNLGCETSVHCMDANHFLYSEKKGFDYVDVDPFGTVLPYLEASIKFLSNHGLLGLSTFDKSTLVGRYAKKCYRTYSSHPSRGFNEKEVGLRILVKEVVSRAGVYDKALTPVYSVDLGDHYRVFFKCRKGARRVDRLLEEVRDKWGAGPLWTGQLWDPILASQVAELDEWGREEFWLIKEESAIKHSTHYHLPSITKALGCTIPEREAVIKKLVEKGFKASRTHFSSQGVRTNASFENVEKVVKSL